MKNSKIQFSSHDHWPLMTKQWSPSGQKYFIDRKPPCDISFEPESCPELENNIKMKLLYICYGQFSKIRVEYQAFQIMPLLKCSYGINLKSHSWIWKWHGGNQNLDLMPCSIICSTFGYGRISAFKFWKPEKKEKYPK